MSSSWAVEPAMGNRPDAIDIRPDAAVASASTDKGAAAVGVASDAVAAAPFFASTRVKRRFRRFHWSWCVCRFRIINASACCLWHLGLLLVEAVVDVCYGLRWTGVMDDGMDSWAVETGIAIRPNAIAIRPDAAVAAMGKAATAVAVATDAVAAAPSRLLIGKFFACTRVKRRFHRFHWSRCVNSASLVLAPAGWGMSGFSSLRL